MKKAVLISFIILGLFQPILSQGCLTCGCPPPTVDIKANNSDGPITIPYNNAVTLTWNSTNASTCQASGGWSGSKPKSGSESTGNLTSSKTYTLTCTGPGGSAQDSVTVNVQPACQDECSFSGQKRCSDSASNQICGNYDSDNCLEWSTPQSCGTGKVCQNGECITQCTSHYTKKCYDNDLYWYDSCQSREDKSQECAEDSWTQNFRCSGNWIQREKIKKGCASDACYSYSQWENWEDCSASGKICQSGQCLIQYPPTIDIKANNSDGPITIPYNNAATLTWTSSNANSCQASGAWSGSKPTSGSESTGNLTSSRTYNLTCTGPGGSAQDSVTVNIFSNCSPVANAGPDKEVYENESVILQGSGSDPDGDPITYSWSCSGGSLSNYNVLQPIFYAPSVSQNTYYSCTLTVTDSQGASNSDSMYVLVREHESPILSVSLSANPSSGCSPLSNVDLTATVYGTAAGYITYFFDCTNDGIWEKIETRDYSPYTAYDLCDYYSTGNYTAKIRVERESLSAENTTQINVYNCYSSPTVDIKANNSDGPITIPYNTSATLSWNSSNADYCYASNNWSGSKSLSGSESTGNLTSSKTYTLTCTGPGGSVSDSVAVNVTAQPALGNLTINKLVRNLSDGTAFSDSVYADPSEVLTFQIQVTAFYSTIYDVILKDTLPEKIVSWTNLKIDGITSGGNVTSGINLGNLFPNQTKTITFDAHLAGSTQFAFGETQLINTAISYTTNFSNSDTAKIVVTKKAVAGAVTGIPTGFTNNFFLDSFFLPLVITFLIIFLFKSHIIQFEEWLDQKKKRYQEYHSKKLLQLKIAHIKTQEFLRQKII